MTDERLKEIKDSIDLQLDVAEALGLATFVEEEKELYEYVEELKKQLEEIMTGKRPIISPYHGDAYLTHEMEYQKRKRLEKQQQEFIKHLEKEIAELKNLHEIIAISSCGSYEINQIQIDILQDILNKYKEIMGVDKK